MSDEKLMIDFEAATVEPRPTVAECDALISGIDEMLGDARSMTVTRPAPFPITTRECGQRAAEMIRAGTVPDSFRDTDRKKMRAKLVVAIRTGADLGMPPATALAKIILLDGRYSILCAGALALAQRSGLVERVERKFVGLGDVDKDGQGDGDIELLSNWPNSGYADYRIWRRGQTEPYVGRYSVADAKRAKSWNNIKRPWWITAPRAMLMVRATAIALHAGFEDVLGGLSILEEVRDLAPTDPKDKTSTDFLADAVTTGVEHGAIEGEQA